MEEEVVGRESEAGNGSERRRRQVEAFVLLAALGANGVGGLALLAAALVQRIAGGGGAVPA